MKIYYWNNFYLSFNIARTAIEAVAIIIVIIVRCAISNIIKDYLLERKVFAIIFKVVKQYLLIK